MTAILRATSGPVFEAAFEAHLAGYLPVLGGVAGGEVHVDDELTWFISGVPDPVANGVLRAHFKTGLTPAALDERIQATLAPFRARRVPMLWWTMPTTQPVGLGTRLIEHGLTPAGEVPGMVVDMRTLPDFLPVPANLVINEVSDEASLGQLAHTFTVGYGLPPATEFVLAEAYRRQGLGPDQPLRHFLAFLEGVPVATASLLLRAGSASLNAIATVPAARRQGIGAAITLAALRAAQAKGYQVAVLQASDQGFPVYRRLGFQECFRLPLFVWSP